MAPQGSTEEQLREMTTPENFEKYKKISLPSVERTVKLSMVFRCFSDRCWSRSSGHPS